ncbi:hypothetical protein FACUT_10735 [Fusarium acutatum]|uniref:Uncharacterized protein n=1 Tax=Fusarium acutatum TaxID=78861 RepID=A0A8H4NLA8_9HYPO|nr:hypothetical protein FACUT_10735 [Fusarium acutatum]
MPGDAWPSPRTAKGSRKPSPQHYAEIVGSPDQSPDRANHLHLRRGASLPDLLARAALGRIPPPLPLDSQSLWDTSAPALSSVQSQSSGTIGLGTFLGELEREASREDQHFIPTAIITTRNTGSIGQGTEDQPWMLPGQVSLTTSLTLTMDTPLIVKPAATQTYVSNVHLLQTYIAEVHSYVFALLLEVLVSPKGLIGQEDELNLPLLLATLSYALDQGMTRETKRPKRTIDRYIPLRMFHHNPHTNSPRLEFEYYEFRSEEVYRAWLVVSQDVPNWCWSGRIHDYDEKFIEDTNTAWTYIKGDPGSRFEQVF